jgi:hypothetical protein
MILLAVLTTAFAASGPKDLPYRGATTVVPIAQSSLTDWSNEPACVRGQGDRLPTLTACRESLKPLFQPTSCAQGGNALVCAPANPAAQPAAQVWGVQSLELEPYGGSGTSWFAIDRAIHVALTYELVDEEAAMDASEAELEAMVRACEADPGALVADTLFLGCAKLDVLDGYDPGSTVLRTKDSFAAQAARGTGVFYTDLDGTPATRCEPADLQLVAITALPIAEACASAVLPEALRRKDALLRQRTAAPADDHAAQRAVAMKLAGAERRRDEIHRLLDEGDELLADASAAEAASRALLTDVQGSTDERWIGLLTELGHLQSELGESSVQLQGARTLAPALKREADALRDKLALLDLDGPILGRLQGEVEALDAQTTRVIAEVHAAWTRVRLTARRADFLHGRLVCATETDPQLARPTAN